MGIHDGHRDKMRQRFLSTGLDGFAPHEVLELLLYYAIPRRDVNPIAHALMDRFPTLADVLDAPLEELKQVEGVGEHSALLLHLTGQILRRTLLEAKDTPLITTQQLGDYLVPLFRGLSREVVYQLCLDKKGKLLCCRKIGEGGIASALADVRQVVANAVLSSATSVVMAHNHPSGLALPSPQDHTFNNRVILALSTMDITLQDHIIVADGDFVSMQESGMMD